MKWQWPWVSRALYDAAIKTKEEWSKVANDFLTNADRERSERLAERIQHEHVLAAVESRHERDMVRSEARYSELMAAYKALKLQGAAEPAKQPAIEPPKQDPIMAAINAKAPDPTVRAQMIRQAERDAAAGLDPEKIIMRINRGNRPAEEVQ